MEYNSLKLSLMIPFLFHPVLFSECWTTLSSLPATKPFTKCWALCGHPCIDALTSNYPSPQEPSVTMPTRQTPDLSASQVWFHTIPGKIPYAPENDAWLTEIDHLRVLAQLLRMLAFLPPHLFSLAFQIIPSKPLHICFLHCHSQQMEAISVLFSCSDASVNS